MNKDDFVKSYLSGKSCMLFELAQGLSDRYGIDLSEAIELVKAAELHRLADVLHDDLESLVR